jgi:hypothetical protein
MRRTRSTREREAVLVEDLLLVGGIVLFCLFIAYERLCNRL